LLRSGARRRRICAFENHRQVPPGSNRRRARQLEQRERLVVRGERGLRDREMRFGNVRIRLRELAHDAQVRGLVGVLNEELAELHEAARRLVLALQELCDIRLGVVDTLHGDQKDRSASAGLAATPDPTRARLLRIEGDVGSARELRELHCASRNPRIARLFCKIEVGFRRGRGFAALRGDLAEQHRIQHLLAQVLLRKLRRRLLRNLCCRWRRVIVVIVVVVSSLCQRVSRDQRREKQCEQEVYCTAHEPVKCRYI
jgi:hypothetical protein